MSNKLTLLKEILYKINIILTKEQKSKSISAFVAITIASLLELFGVTIVVPFISAVMNPESIAQNKYIILLLDLFKFQTPSSSITLVILGIILMLVYIIKNIGLIFSRYIQN